MSERPNVTRRGTDPEPEVKWTVADVRLFVAMLALLAAGVVVGMLIVRMF